MKKQYKNMHFIAAGAMLGAFVLFQSALYAQSFTETVKTFSNPSADQAPSGTAKKNLGPAETNALWDIQFNYNITDTTKGTLGYAGIAFTGTHFWVSRWQSDTIIRFTPAGGIVDTIKVPGVTGIRSFTYDGTSLYAGVNTTTIQKIDPNTKTAIGTIPSPVPVRHMTYDSTANGGAGGLWVGNFSTTIYLISLTGTKLDSIMPSAHGLLSMYGSAIDHWTAGGPYLWIFDQGGASKSWIRRIKIAPGGGSTLTPASHDVFSDIGIGETSSLAGALFITNKWDPSGKRTIMGTLQGTPKNHMFGYELNDYVPPPTDASIDSIKSGFPFILIPKVHGDLMDFTGKVTNTGGDTIKSYSVTVDVKSGTSTVFTATVPSVAALAPLVGSSLTTSTSYSPLIKGTFSVNGKVSIASPQTDSKASNDTLSYTFEVNDTIFGRENRKPATGSLGIGSGGGTLGQTFTTKVTDKIKSITMVLTKPSVGDTVRGYIYTFTTMPGTKLDSTDIYIFKAADTNGVEITLPLINGPLSVAPGTYFVGVREYSKNVTLGTTDFNYRPAAGWVIFGTNPWNPSEFYNFKKTYLLRMNVEGGPSSVEENTVNGNLSVYPNPSSGAFILTASFKTATDVTISIVNVLGEEMYRSEASGVTQRNIEINLSDKPSGIYFVKLESEYGSAVSKISLVR